MYLFMYLFISWNLYQAPRRTHLSLRGSFHLCITTWRPPCAEANTDWNLSVTSLFCCQEDILQVNTYFKRCTGMCSYFSRQCCWWYVDYFGSIKRWIPCELFSFFLSKSEVVLVYFMQCSLNVHQGAIMGLLFGWILNDH